MAIGKKVQELEIIVPPLNTGVLTVTIKGKKPLIMEEWSEKAKRQMAEKHQKKATGGRGARNPEEEFEAAKVKNRKGELALKAICVKSAIVDTARFVKDLPMTILRGALFVRGDDDGFIKLKYEKVEMVEDAVRLSGIGRTADLRYRPYVYGWEANLKIEFDRDVLSKEQVLNLLVRAGFSNGLGGNRPERSGNEYGTFEVTATN